MGNIAAKHSEAMAALYEKQARERAELERKYAILATLPDGYDWRVHVHRLYDRDASVTLGERTISDIRLMVQQGFPVRPLSLYRDGCAGIRTTEDAEREYQKAQSRMAEGEETSATAQPIAPFWITIEPFQRATAIIHWIADLFSTGLRVEFRTYTDVAKLGTLSVKYGQDGRDWYEGARGGRERVITVNTFTPGIEINVLGNARVEVIRFASGSPTTPGPHLLYWDSCDGEHADTTLEHLLVKLEGVANL